MAPRSFINVHSVRREFVMSAMTTAIDISALLMSALIAGDHEKEVLV